MLGDVFVHHTVIYAKGFRSLNTGEQLEFTVIQKEGKWHATSVTGPNGSHVEGWSPLSSSPLSSYINIDFHPLADYGRLNIYAINDNLLANNCRRCQQERKKQRLMRTQGRYGYFCHVVVILLAVITIGSSLGGILSYYIFLGRHIATQFVHRHLNRQNFVHSGEWARPARRFPGQQQQRWWHHRHVQSNRHADCMDRFDVFAAKT